MAAIGSVQKSEEEWQAILSPEQFRILRQKGRVSRLRRIRQVLCRGSLSMCRMWNASL
ncbi:hypothetical protein I3843_01G141400 [Carya illinoinensis]|uniref:Peptide-methionine (R)-S-oxide reductase n=1 Tax=Carya illinoinensis TaxID=32201 RepID=A0A922G3R7_CARIL|nr:hypothetical protein I3842_01G149100 [Carya illinoinensis]KAG7996068.1 hypothetical protein I3843_01G141400 [Carya illinoinensis]